MTFLAELAVAWALTLNIFGLVTLITMAPDERHHLRHWAASILGIQCRHRFGMGRCAFPAFHPGPHKVKLENALDRETRAEKSIASDFRRAA